ncbi:uncharacterized protein LOC105917276 isoform X2 [Fundulus heteroclitus]|uniref:uncharacterized protein LOC105917276 isoform X2 n=1 Tax=Fundulus heteroclitus TaxID=8078 RepID=UPI00165CEB2B|nr:uncharacterized protein LOC105917276 isoform X2 [Fundulus heteroclitus]
MAQMRRRCILNCDGETTLYALPRGDEEKEQWLRFLFNTVPTQYNPRLLLCAAHFTQDSFLNWAQFYCGYSKRLLLKDGAVPTLQNLQLNSGGFEYRVKPKYPVPSAVNHVASQTDLPSIELPGTRTVSTQLNKESISNLRSTDTQVRVRSRDCGVCTETLPLDSPLLLPDARPEKRPRLSLAEEEGEEEEEEGPSESSGSTVVQDKTNLT